MEFVIIPPPLINTFPWLWTDFQTWIYRFFKTLIVQTIFAPTLKIPPWLRAKKIKKGGGI